MQRHAQRSMVADCMTEQPDSRCATIDVASPVTAAAARLVRRVGLLLLCSVGAMGFGATAQGAVPTVHVTPAAVAGSAYVAWPFQIASGRVRCEVHVGRPQGSVVCYNGRKGLLLAYNGDRVRWLTSVRRSPTSRTVPAGTRLAIHVSDDGKVAYYCRAYRTAMSCTHSVHHNGILVGVGVARKLGRPVDPDLPMY